MTTEQFTREQQHSPWTFHKETKSFSVEMSDLQGAGGFKQYLHDGPKVTGPTGKQVYFREFTPHTDGDGDLVYWTYQTNGFTYTIFND